MTSRSHDRDPHEHDPSAELGLKRPVRDNARLGDEKYNVTPPRSAVRAPGQDQAPAHSTCAACDAEIDPKTAYRSDAEEYVYHFCGSACYERWRGNRPGSADRSRGTMA